MLEVQDASTESRSTQRLWTLDLFDMFVIDQRVSYFSLALNNPALALSVLPSPPDVV